MLNYGQLYILAQNMRSVGINDNEIARILENSQIELIKDKAYDLVSRVIGNLNTTHKPTVI